MTVVKYILAGLYIIVCLALIIITTFQSKDSENKADIMEGPTKGNFYEKNKGRTKQGKTQKNTIILGIAFGLITVALGIIFVV